MAKWHGHAGLFMWPKLPYNILTGFQGRALCKRDETGEKEGGVCVWHIAFYDLTSEVTQHHLWHFLFVQVVVKASPISKGKERDLNS